MKLSVTTMQEAFDDARNHLLSMRRRAVEDGSPKYRTSDGRRCAIGSLIPDSEYDPEADEGTGGYTVGTLINRELLETELPLMFLRQLQAVHDQPENWTPAGDGEVLNIKGHQTLAAIAHEYRLDIS